MSQSLGLPIFLAFAGFLLASEGFLLNLLFNVASEKIPDKSKVRDRLKQISSDEGAGYINFRIAQLSIAIIGVLTICAIYFLGIISAPFSVFLAILTIGFSIMWFEVNLTKRVEKKNKSIEAEFPPFVEMLTLCIGAGESPAAAISRVVHRSHGVLHDEFETVVKSLEQGKSLVLALDELNIRLGSFPIRRFSDALIISMQRGTPIVQTLITHASDARKSERNLLLAKAAKAEISMMIPVVFLILPVSILFALYPSISSLSIFAG